MRSHMAGERRDIQERTMEYALRSIKVFSHLQLADNRAGWIIGNQFLRAASSVGANMAEAQAAESRPDFIHKCSIAQKEARESKYWLTLLQKSRIVTAEKLGPLVQETNEIVAIITKIIV